MSLYWVNNNVLDNAFNDINIGILPVDFSKWWGHVGNIIRIKIMEKITDLYYSSYVNPQHKEIIKSLHLMLHECEKHLTNTLTSPSMTSSVIHENHPFKFYDFEKKKTISILYNKSNPTETTFEPKNGPRKSRLIEEIRNKNRENILNLIENSIDCLPDLIFYGKSALMILIEMGEMNDIAIKLIDKYGCFCLINDIFLGNQKIKHGIELIVAISFKNEEIALKLINTFGVKYSTDHINVNGDSLLMLSIKYNLLNLCEKLIEQYDAYCLPSQVNQSGETALILACERSHEDIALKLINKFGMNTCLVNKKNCYGKTAMTFAEERQLSEFIKKVNNINKFSEEIELSKIMEKLTDRNYAIKLLDYYTKTKTK